MLSNKVCIDGLVHQIQLMAHGRRIINAPLPIETLRTCLRDSLGIFGCHLVQFMGYYACNNIFVSSFGWTYNHFCMGVHLETKAIVFAIPFVGKYIV